MAARSFVWVAAIRERWCMRWSVARATAELVRPSGDVSIYGHCSFDHSPSPSALHLTVFAFSLSSHPCCLMLSHRALHFPCSLLSIDPALPPLLSASDSVSATARSSRLLLCCTISALQIHSACHCCVQCEIGTCSMLCAYVALSCGILLPSQSKKNMLKSDALPLHLRSCHQTLVDS